MFRLPSNRSPRLREAAKGEASRPGLRSPVIRMTTTSSYLAREIADVIVSGDEDLLDWPEQQRPVRKPTEFETDPGRELTPATRG